MNKENILYYNEQILRLLGIDIVDDNSNKSEDGGGADNENPRKDRLRTTAEGSQ
jgi:hypothetical protein